LYVGGRKAKQNAQMRFLEQAGDRQRESQKAQQHTHKSKTVKKLLAKPEYQRRGQT